jgi:multicomponent Na+:H+ antiporter subunit G
MQILEWIRYVVGAALLLGGLAIFLIEIYGIFHLDYVLNRMHAAAMGDTLGISCSLLGLMVFCGLNFTTLKLALIIGFFWFASPVSSHLLARLEVTTNENLEEHCSVYEDLQVLEEELEKRKEEEASEGRQL